MEERPINSILSEKHTTFIISTILILYPLIGMGVDLISPSLPAISHSLKASSEIVKNIISIFLFGYAFGNFFIGLLSDSFGRRKLIIISFFVFSLISLLPVFFENLFIILVCRFIQGFFIGGFAVVSRAVFSDILPTIKLKQVAPFISTMWGIGPIIGPVIGGYLQYYFNWQACFLFFSLFGFLGFIAIFFIIPETHFNRHDLNIATIKNNLITIVTHRLFFGLITLMGIAYSVLIVFNTLGPFLIQTYLGKSSIYFGHIALCMGISFLTGTFASRFLIKKYEPEKTLFYVLLLFLFIALFGLLFAYLDGKNIIVIVTPTLCLFFGIGIIYPTAMAKALTLFRNVAGSSSAVMNLINILITSIVAMCMSFVNPTSFIPIAWVFVILLLLSILTYWLTIKVK